MKKKVKFKMNPFAKYEFEGEEYTWLWDSIIVEVSYNRNESAMYHAAYVKIAKYITSSLSNYKKSQWKYINKLNFHIVNDKTTIKIRKKNVQPIIEYTDLFGVNKEILSNGKERIKPIKKGE